MNDGTYRAGMPQRVVVLAALTDRQRAELARRLDLPAGWAHTGVYELPADDRTPDALAYLREQRVDHALAYVARWQP